MRNIAITDLETTGLYPAKHEIIEIGLVLVRQPDLEIIDTLDVKVKPEHIHSASTVALELNGYDEKTWEDACDLEEAMGIYLAKVEGAIFCAHNIGFDLSFIKEACSKTGLQNTLDYHCIDIPSLAWFALRKSGMQKTGLRKVAEFLGLEPEPKIHRAINGAMLAYEVLRKLVLLEGE